MSSIPRHALEIVLEDLELQGFQLLFCSFGAGETEEALLSDSEEEEDVCVKKVLTITEPSQVLTQDCECCCSFVP